MSLAHGVDMTQFEWDPTKAASNIRKHGLSFEIASRAFFDPFAITVPDRVQDAEQRWRTIGEVDGTILVVVIHTFPDPDGEDEVIRIISARKAETRERRRYAQQSQH